MEPGWPRNHSALLSHGHRQVAEPGGVPTLQFRDLALHCARHRLPNGVVRQTGEFIHIALQAWLSLAWGIGAKVSVVGELSMTVLGIRLLKAHEVNHMKLL